MGMIIMNGKEYTSSPKDGFPPIVYSDEEREIGVWRDGKPLYQKTWECTLPAISGSKTGEYVSLINLPDVSVKTVEAYESNGASLYPFTGYSGSKGTQLVNFRYLEGYIKLYDIGVPYSAGEVITVTVKYTKNSDTAGSGKWATDGGLAKHYSTSEQIIGTWIDGKPLYEKVIDCGAGPNKTTKAVAHNIANLKDVVNFGGYMRASSYSTPIFKINDASANNQAVIEVSDTVINIISRNNNISALNCIVILQYTKTTD